MNLESKIRWKATLLYAVVGIAIAVITVLFYGLRTQIGNEREKIAQQRQSLYAINELINVVNTTQTTANLYISTHNRNYLLRFDSAVARVKQLNNKLKNDKLYNKQKLAQTVALLTQQSTNLRMLNECFQRENPLTPLTQRLSNYQPPLPVETKSIHNQLDTTVKVTKKKGFFRRLAQVFSPERDSTVIIHNQQIVRLKTADSLAIISEVKNIAHRAGISYDTTIRNIEKQVAGILTSEREIAVKVSGILMELHEQSFRHMQRNISSIEASIERNYLFSVIAGAMALVLILVFIMLIIFDVNKGKSAREKIRQLMESRHQLLLAVSHDIKSPLHSIGGYLELQPDSEAKHAMQNSVRHIAALLENLLEFSSLEQGTLTMTLHCVSLQSLCTEAEQMFRPMAQAKKLALHCSADNVRLRVDPIKLKQIIINLMSNSVKYTRQGEINASLTYSDSRLLLRVRDTGVGIPEDHLPDLFKPFSRVERNNSLANGTGLGMYVVKGLVEIAGGTISVESEIDRGTLFEVSLPAESVETTIPKGTKQIGLYDDDPVMLGIVRDMLHKLGHKIVEKDAEIILTDMEMNELSGTDILASAGNIPVVVMTGRSDFSYEKARELGFSDFLAKPFNIDALRMIFGEGELGMDDFLGEDEEEIRAVFREATAQNVEELKEALTQNDYKKAQQLCHKMRPMFMLLGYPSDELTRMDTHRGSDYEGWQLDVERILAIKV